MSELHTRKEKRTPVTLKIKFKSATLDQFIERYSVDVSHGGIFIRTKDPLAVGTQLRFEFQLQDASPLIAGDGTVVWTREFDPSRVGVAPGMGVRFDRLAPESQPVLDQILTRKVGGPRADVDRFESAQGSSPGLSQTTGEKTRITPPTLASSLVAASTRPIAASEKPAARGNGPVAAMSPARGGFADEARDRDNTPLPKPMPFHIAGEDEFSEDVFEQPTKVASLDTLLKHEEEHARAAQAAEAARVAPLPVPPAEHEHEDEQTNVVPKPTSGARARPVAPVAPSVAPARPAPTPTLPLMNDDEPTPAVQPRASSEPRFLENHPPGSVPIELASTSPSRKLSAAAAPVPSATTAAKKKSATLPILLTVLVLGGAAAAVYTFVIAPGQEEQGSTPPPSRTPTKVDKPTEPTAPLTKPLPSETAPPTAPTPAAAKVVEVVIEAQPAQAEISVNGGPASPGPMKAKLESGKGHQIAAMAACHKQETVSIVPSADGENKHLFKLKPLERVVRISTTPPAAAVFVDGKPAGKTPGEVKLVGKLDPRVEHTFTFRKPGFEDTVTKVTPDAPCVTDGDVGVVGLSLTLSEVIRKPPAPAPAPVPVVTPRKPPPPAPSSPKAVPVAKPPEPKAEPVAEPPKPPEPKAEPVAEPPKPEPSSPKAEPVAEPPKPEPKPEPVAEPPKAEPSSPKAEPVAPKPEAKPENKDCDPSPDAPDWARCK